MLELFTGFADDTEWVLFTEELRKTLLIFIFIFLIILNLVYLLSDFVICL